MVTVASKSNETQPVSLSRKLEDVASTPLLDLIGWVAVFGCAFLNLVNVVDKEEVGLDPQVLAKLGMLGVSGLYGVHGVLTRPRVRKILMSFPVAWILILVLFYFIAVPFSPSARNALVSSCSIIAILFMMVTALDHLGVIKVVQAMFCGMGFFVFGSWIAYFVFPEIGVLKEAITNGEFAYRMSGLAHANTLGQYSGLTFVLAVILGFSYKKRNIFIFAVGILALGALFSSFSRTSLMACGLSLLVGYRHIYLKKKLIPTYLFIGVAGLLCLLVLSTQMDLGEKIASKLQLLSKSDDTEELTTATGRLDIWAHAIRLIQERPATGYGAATQASYFQEFSLYTHNLLLNITFSAGIFAGITGLLMLLGRLRAMIYYGHPLADTIIAFIVINGLFENVIFSTLAGLPTMLLVLALAWPLLADDPSVAFLSRSEIKPSEPSRYIRLEGS